MTRSAISKYFDATQNRKTRDDLLFAVKNVVAPKIAVDCGCGAGADIGYLSSQGFTVHAFDVEEEAIARCSNRFHGIDNVHLTKATFATYVFPEASLVVADASLFFCPKLEFPVVWKRIYDCLRPGGIFSGSFLGQEDTMAMESHDAGDFWPASSVFAQEEVVKLLEPYEVLRFTVHKSSGTTPSGEPHNWHIFSTVAKKPAKARLTCEKCGRRLVERSFDKCMYCAHPLGEINDSQA